MHILETHPTIGNSLGINTLEADCHFRSEPQPIVVLSLSQNLWVDMVRDIKVNKKPYRAFFAVVKALVHAAWREPLKDFPPRRDGGMWAPSVRKGCSRRFDPKLLEAAPNPGNLHNEKKKRGELW